MKITYELTPKWMENSEVLRHVQDTYTYLISESARKYACREVYEYLSYSLLCFLLQIKFKSIKDHIMKG